MASPIVEGLKKEFPGRDHQLCSGHRFLGKRKTWPVPAEVLSTDGKPGAKVSMYLKQDIVSAEIVR